MARTGFMAPFDAPALDTAKIAIDKINAAGGVLGCKIKLIEVDGETNPDKGAQIATDLIAQGAKMMLVEILRAGSIQADLGRQIGELGAHRQFGGTPQHRVDVGIDRLDDRASQVHRLARLARAGGQDRRSCRAYLLQARLPVPQIALQRG